jgi:hypothetical protein
VDEARQFQPEAEDFTRAHSRGGRERHAEWSRWSVDESGSCDDVYRTFITWSALTAAGKLRDATASCRDENSADRELGRVRGMRPVVRRHGLYSVIQSVDRVFEILHLP